jgi:hypothetical protein
MRIPLFSFIVLAVYRASIGGASDAAWRIPLLQDLWAWPHLSVL